MCYFSQMKNQSAETFKCLLLLTILCSSVWKCDTEQDVGTGESSHCIGGYVPNSFSFSFYYQSNMVLQAYPAQSIIWGFAPVKDINSSVYLNVTNAFQLLQYKTSVTKGPLPNVAIWQVTLDPITNVHPFGIVASLKSYKTLYLQNVLFGDVWFCSGQSNMKFTMGEILNSSQEAEEAEKFSQIRFFSVGQVQSASPLIDVSNIEINWSVPNRVNILPFSAVCWLFAKNIYKQRPLPMGLVESSWGGTEIEAWSSPESLKSCGIKSERNGNFNPFAVFDTSKYADGNERNVQDASLPFNETKQSLSLDQNTANSQLWNAMVYPLLKMTIYGVLWYQGEANANYNRDVYNCTLPAMVKDWRQKWYAGTNGQTNISFPFGIVQLGPTSEPPAIAGYADIRWHQTADIGYLPNERMSNTFMAVAYDLADKVGGVHFRDKITLSRRLALAGMAVAYGRTDQKYIGPLVTTYTLDMAKSLMTLEYDNGKHPIVVKNKEGFEICCQKDSTRLCSLSGQDWLPATLTSWNNYTVTLPIKACEQQYLMGFRFAWRETPCLYRQATVYSAENDLPAPPFILRRRLGAVSGRWQYHSNEEKDESYSTQEDSEIHD